jgi:hypothetical protein
VEYIQTPIQWIPGVKRPGREAGHSSSSVEIKTCWAQISWLPSGLHFLGFRDN